MARIPSCCGSAPIRPLAWEPPYAVSLVLKRQKKEKRVELPDSGFKHSAPQEKLQLAGSLLIVGCVAWGVVYSEIVSQPLLLIMRWFFLFIRPVGVAQLKF